jgi:hypothetical protein
MHAKQVQWNDEQPRSRGWQYGRHRVGSWQGPPPRGGVVLATGAARGRDFDRMDNARNWREEKSQALAMLDLNTGIVHMIGPKGKLP